MRENWRKMRLKYEFIPVNETKFKRNLYPSKKCKYLEAAFCQEMKDIPILVS